MARAVVVGILYTVIIVVIGPLVGITEVRIVDEDGPATTTTAATHVRRTALPKVIVALEWRVLVLSNCCQRKQESQEQAQGISKWLAHNQTPHC